MAYRNKTYVCFDGDTDMRAYRLMCAWKQHEGIDFNFYNAHDLNSARDSSQEETIKRQLRERLKNSFVLVVLVGKNTKNLYRFVRWEMEQAISLGLAIIAVNLNGKREKDEQLCPPILRDELVVHVSFNAAIIQHALETWPEDHANYKKSGKIASYRYTPSTYEKLGL